MGSAIAIDGRQGPAVTGRVPLAGAPATAERTQKARSPMTGARGGRLFGPSLEMVERLIDEN